MTSSLSTSADEYVLPRVWKDNTDMGGSFAAINRPTAGARFEKELPVGKHDLQLYSMGTPNGQKVTILLEELLELGITEADYDAWLISIMEQDQFGSGFVEINPNSKIPALRDYGVKDGKKEPLNVFESGSILIYLADKFGKFLPPTSEIRERTQVLNWLMFQMGSAPFLGGGFGHFFVYAPVKIPYALDRFTMETKRQFDVLDKHLAKHQFMLGDGESAYTIADMALWPWYGQLALGQSYANATEFLDIEASYPNVIRWAKEISSRPAVQRGIMVNKKWGPPEQQLWERHDASDFTTKTEAAKAAAKDA